MSMIRVKGLHKYYAHRTHVLKDVSLTLPDTGLVCLLGESGSGKTTLLNTVGGLDGFGPGRVCVGRHKLRGRVGRAAEAMRNEFCGYVFQNYFLLRDRSVYDNLHIALSLYELTEAEKDARIQRVLEAVELTRYRKRQVSMLSGGQQQRVAIARALVRTSRVIFADEPTGNLDEANTLLVMNTLKRVSTHCLVVLATHEKRIASFYADRIISIRDGAVVSDEQAAPGESYRYADDSALYLDEYEHSAAQAERIHVDYYGSEPLSIRLVRDRGRLYVAVPDGVKAELIDASSGVQLKTGPRSELHRREETEPQLRLPELQNRRHGRLPLREIAAMARRGMQSGVKRLIVPVAAMLATAVLCMIAVTDTMTLSAIDKEDFINTDSRYLAIGIAPASHANSMEVSGYLNRLLTELRENGPACMLYARYNTELRFSYRGFSQIDNLSDVLYEFTIVPGALFDPATLIAGRLQQGPNEVIVDRWVLERFMGKKTTLSQSITGIQEFLGQQLEIVGKGYSVTIVGISDCGEPAIFFDTVAGLSCCIAGTHVAPLSSLKHTYPGVFDDVTLGPDDVLLNEHRYTYATNKEIYRSAVGAAYQIKGTFPEAFPAVFVIGDAYDEALVYSLISNARSFAVYAEDKEAVKRFLESGLSAELTQALRITVDDEYSERMAQYETARALKLDARLLVSIMVTLLSFVVLFVVMKANAVRDIKAIAVYRLLGISKASVSSVYLLETLMLSLYTTLPAALLTQGVLAALTQIESLGLDLTVSFPAALATVGALVALNLLTAVLPILRLLRIPPAQLAAQYDI